MEGYSAVAIRSKSDTKLRGIDYAPGEFPELADTYRKAEWDDQTWANVVSAYHTVFDSVGRRSNASVEELFAKSLTMATTYVAEFGMSLEQIAKHHPPRPQLRSSRSVFIEDMPANSSVAWLIDGSIPQGAIGFLAGASGSGKTFVMLDIIQSLWRGLDWFGRKVDRPGGAYVVASEGAYSIAPRLGACGEHRFGERRENARRGPILMVEGAPDLTSIAGRKAFMEDLKLADIDMRARYGLPIRLVVIETFAQTFNVRDENSASDVTAATKIMTEISQCLSEPVAVMASHHFGKAMDGMRGSSALRANVDFVIEIRGSGELVQEKIKDAPEGRIGYFDMPIVSIGQEADGRTITSRYVRQTNGPVRGAARVQAKPLAAEFTEAFDACAKLHNGTKRASTAELREALFARWPDVKNRRSKFSRLVDTATAYGYEKSPDWIVQA